MTFFMIKKRLFSLYSQFRAQRYYFFLTYANFFAKKFFFVAKKVWYNTDKINEQKKVQKIIAQTYVN